jgi:protein SCO1
MQINKLYVEKCLRRPFMLRHVIASLAAIFLLCGCEKTPSFHSTDITGASFGHLSAVEALTDHTGRRLASADFLASSRQSPFLGKAVVIFFGYTQCPDICPTTLTTMKEAMRLLGPDADRVQVLFITVDPERDTQEILAAYVPWFDPRFLGLRADPDITRATAREYRVYYSKVEGKTALGYSIDHSATSYAYDPQGRLRLLINHGATAQHISEDLSMLLAGK